MRRILIITFLVNLFAICAFAQTTEFTYQGSLKDGSNPANANYDFEFALYDSLSGGTQLGSTLTRSAVAVANGSFAVKLDFGSQFTGANRFLEIRVRLTGQPGITPLNPRQQISNAPYAVRSLNAANADSAVNATNATNATNAVNATNATNATTATNALQLGGVAANQYVLTTDSRLSDARTPLPGSTDYIQNRTTQQASSNFNVSGTGTASVFDAATQFSIGGNRILSNPGSLNLFAGVNAGTSNTSGASNTFFGNAAGSQNTVGNGNSFFGRSAGENSTGSGNSFFGALTGNSNTGSNNAFFGVNNGQANTGAFNAFFGYQAGLTNTSGNNNTFVGAGSGRANTTGIQNSFFGSDSGRANVNGNGNSFFGTATGDANIDGFSNAFFGAGAGGVNTSGDANVFIGAAAGPLNDLGNNNSFVGTSSGFSNSTGQDNAFFGSNAGASNVTGSNNTIIGSRANVSLGANNLNFATALGSYANVGTSDTIVLGKVAGTYDGVPRPADTVQIPGTLNVTGTINGTVSNATNATNAATANNALNLGGVAANQYVVTTDPRMTDARSPIAGSDNYIQNRTTPQGGNFNIGGDGTVGGSLSANIINAETQFNVGGTRVLQATDNYLLLGRGISGAAGLTNATAIGNQARVFASNNLILGSHPDFFNPNIPNTFIGIGIGIPTTKLDVVGKVLIRSNNFNAPAGGGLFGLLNVVQVGTGDANFYMQGANGGRGINFAVNRPTFNDDAKLNISHFDGTTYKNRLTIDQNGNVGIGTITPGSLFHVSGPGIIRARINSDSNGGIALTINDQPGWSVASANGGHFQIFNDGIGQNAFSINAATNFVGINSLASGSTQLCRDASNQISNCSSSIRYKSNINSFNSGLSLMDRLRPVSFTWKDGGMLDLGLIAEEVAEVEPLLVTHNDKGEVEGVKYDRIGVIAVNAIKEQQLQIEEQARQLAGQKEINQRLQSQIDALTRIICKSDPSAEVCKEEK